MLKVCATAVLVMRTKSEGVMRPELTISSHTTCSLQAGAVRGRMGGKDNAWVYGGGMGTSAERQAEREPCSGVVMGIPSQAWGCPWHPPQFHGRLPAPLPAVTCLSSMPFTPLGMIRKSPRPTAFWLLLNTAWSVPTIWRWEVTQVLFHYNGAQSGAADVVSYLAA